MQFPPFGFSSISWFLVLLILLLQVVQELVGALVVGSCCGLNVLNYGVFDYDSTFRFFLSL